MPRPYFALGAVHAGDATTVPVATAGTPARSSAAPTVAPAALPTSSPAGAAPSPGSPAPTALPASPSPAAAPPSPAAPTLLAGDVTQADFVDGAGAAARFDQPLGVAVLPDGGVVVTDRNNHRVRLLRAGPDAHWSVTTLAGDGSSGYQDGAGDAAEFDEPSGVAVDERGVVFVSDPWNHCVRRIALSTTGKAAVTTLVGIQEVGSDDGGAPAARFDHPFALALDGRHHLFVTERFAQTIRMITLDPTTSEATMVATVAGTFEQTGSADGVGAAARFDQPVAIAVDPRITDHTVLYVIGEGNCRLRRIDVDDAGSGTVSTLDGQAGSCGFADGPIATAQFEQPLGLVVDPTRGILLGDATDGALRLVAGTPPVVSTPVGGALGTPAAASGPTSPQGLALAPGGGYYVVDGNAVRWLPPLPTASPLN